MLYDISPPLSPALAVWPGDVPLTRELQMEIAAGDAVTLSALRCTAHLGAHADAPSHITADGATIDQMELDTYLGPCQVIHVTVPSSGRITPRDIREPLCAPRVLLATGRNADRTRFAADYAALTVEVADWLHAHGVRLVGIDSPSVDAYGNAGLPVHRRLVGHGIAILENLHLTDTPTGTYELIALPLRLVGFDGSPLRAVLRS